MQTIKNYIKDLPWGFIVMLVFLRIGVVEANIIPTGSMEPTIVPGDRIFMDRTAYGFHLPFRDRLLVRWAEPQRGEIVSFHPAHTEQTLIKRVIGVAGDVIETRQGLTWLNGQRLAVGSKDGFIRERLDQQSWLTTLAYPLEFGPVTVPPGHVFVMGDNRGNSADSRYWGVLPVDRVRARASLRFFNAEWLSNPQGFHRLGAV